MSTSIRDLLAQVEWNLNNQAAPSPQTATEAIETLRPIGRGVALLADVRLPRERQSAMRQLATHCETASDAWPPPHGRNAQLIGAAADIIGRLAPTMSAQENWAATCSLTHLAIIAARAGRVFPPHNTSPVLQDVHAAAAVLEQATATDIPTVAGQKVLDRLIPNPSITAEAGIVAAAEAAPTLVAAVHATVARSGLTLAEFLTCTLAAELSARHGQLVAEAVRGPAEDTQPWHATADAWKALRVHCRPFDDGTKKTKPDHSEVIEVAERLIDSLRREFGRPSDASPDALRRRDDLPELATHIRAVANQLPDLAVHLERARKRWLEEHRMAAPERKLASFEHRPPGRTPTANRIVLVGKTDLTDLATAVADARHLSVALAYQLDRGSDRVGRQPQPAIAAAHGAMTSNARSLGQRANRAQRAATANQTPTWAIPTQRAAPPRRSAR
jgi:hypothetical protein